MMRYRILLLILISAAQVPAYCQLRPLGSWKMYTSFNSMRSVTEADDVIFAASPYALLKVTLSTKEMEVLDKAKGLSDFGIDLIRYDKESGLCMLVYSNSNIDLIDAQGNISNIPDFKNNNEPGDKRVYDLCFNQGHAYLASGSFVLDFDMIKKEFTANYVIGSGGSTVKVFDVTTLDGYIYAATEEGVKKASLSASNLQDYTQWQLISELPASPAQEVFAKGSALYAVMEDTLFEKSGSSWIKRYHSSSADIKDVTVESNQALLTIIFPDTNSNPTNACLLKIDDLGDTSSLRNTGMGYPLSSIISSSNKIWVADNWRGLLQLDASGLTEYRPNSPSNNQFFRMAHKDGALYIASGAVNGSYNYTFIRDGFYKYEGFYWSTHNQYTDPQMEECLDIIAVAIDPFSGDAAFGSYFGGLVDFRNDSVQVFDQYNSILEGAIGDELRTRVSGLAYDLDGNLWIMNYGAPNPIVVRKADGNWNHFSASAGLTETKFVFIDSYKQKWIPLNSQPGYGLLVYSEGADLDNPGDDVNRRLTTAVGSGALSNAVVNSVTEDKNGEIWVGTNTGICVFGCKESVLTSTGCDARLVYAERDGFTRPIFEEEKVNVIRVDGGNRKWVGTTSGLYLISSNGDEQLLHFNTDNSPLPSNEILDVAIDEKTGEVFIITASGLLSYMGDATVGGESNAEDLIIFPNPVEHDYEGPLAIQGLVEQAFVKITDISGGLVYEAFSNGGTFTWDLKDYNGRRAASGVYFVWVSNPDGTQKKVGKFVLMN